jgi:hypothetical protein
MKSLVQKLNMLTKTDHHYVPWKRNRLLHGRPLLVTEYRPSNSEIRLTRKAASKKLLFRVWAPRARIVTFLNIPTAYAADGDGLHKLLKSDQNRYSRFRESRHFVFWGPYES